jgi:hypothetical protein
LFENTFDRFAQAIQNSLIVGASNIHWHEVARIKSGPADEFLEEFLLGIGSAGAHEQELSDLAAFIASSKMAFPL